MAAVAAAVVGRRVQCLHGSTTTAAVCRRRAILAAKVVFPLSNGSVLKRIPVTTTAGGRPLPSQHFASSSLGVFRWLALLTGVLKEPGRARWLSSF